MNMRTTQYPNTCGALALICAMLILSGWNGCSHNDKDGQHRPNPSPITVADGSMKVRTRSHFTFDSNTNTLTIDGGQACSIEEIGTGNKSNVINGDWELTGSDPARKASIKATNQGRTIVATGPPAKYLKDDNVHGRGYEFGPATFSPAGLDNPKNSFNCKAQDCRIDYEPVGQCK
jgi:hypothetical protein